MLEGLENINWNKLKHAYGSAEDVPNLIRELASPDPETCKQALWELYGNIWHQGTVYEATAYAVPFLAELLDAPEGVESHKLLLFLISLANGHSYLDVHQHLTFAYSGPNRGSPEFQAKLAEELGWVRAAHDAVYSHQQLYFRLLAEGDQPTRSVAAHLFASFPEHYQDNVHRLQGRLSIETDNIVIASLLITLGSLIPMSEGETANFILSYLGTENTPLIRFAAATALIFIYRESVPDEAIHILVDTLKSREDVNEEYRQMYWTEDDIGVAISTALCFAGSQVGEPFIPLLISALPTMDFFSVVHLAEALMYLAFGSQKLPHNVQMSDLASVQRQTLQAIADHAIEIEFEGQKSVSVDVGMLLGNYGLPGQPDQLKRFLKD